MKPGSSVTNKILDINVNITLLIVHLTSKITCPVIYYQENTSWPKFLCHVVLQQVFKPRLFNVGRIIGRLKRCNNYMGRRRDLRRILNKYDSLRQKLHENLWQRKCSSFIPLRHHYFSAQSRAQGLILPISARVQTSVEVQIGPCIPVLHGQ